MYAKVCDICNGIIMKGEGELLNGNNVLIHIYAETEKNRAKF